MSLLILVREGVMKILLALVLGIAVALPAVIAAAAEPDLYKADAGPYRVQETKTEWRDESRDREIPVKIYAPKDADGARPTIIVSHGLGGSREGLAYLGRHWASHGYVAVHLQHAGSDSKIWQGKSKDETLGAMLHAVKDLKAWIDRPLDVRFAIDQVLAGPLKVRSESLSIDHARLAVAGHSFGGWTALASAGITFNPLGVSPPPTNYGDTRLVASISLSGGAFRTVPPIAFDTVRIPTLHMTGTEDRITIGDIRPEEQRNAYGNIRNAPKYLVILDGGDHMIFAGSRQWGGKKNIDARHLAIIRSTTTAFLDSVVNGDGPASVWLANNLFNIGSGVALSEQAVPD
jgi:predicted dienelactone hydrolase